MKIHLHLGVHKTATTHLQEMLKVNCDRLKEQGVFYFTLDEFRRKIEEIRDNKVDNQAHLLKQYIEKEANGFDKVILSEENLIGLTYHIFKQKGLYKRLKMNLSILQYIMMDHECEFFMSIRNMKTFLPSIYSEALHIDEYQPFSMVYQGEIYNVFWFNLIDDLLNFRIKTNIWCYEDYAEKRKEILSELTFNVDVDWDQDISPDPRTISSQQLIECYQEICEELNIKNKYIYYKLRKYFPLQSREERFQPFDMNQMKKLDLNYQLDIQEIKKRALVNFI